jgi:hypothetical protein
MASFNQAPLGQSPLAFSELQISVGSDAPNAPVQTSVATFVSDGSMMGPTQYANYSPIKPGWRRSNRPLSANY